MLNFRNDVFSFTSLLSFLHDQEKNKRWSRQKTKKNSKNERTGSVLTFIKLNVKAA